MKRIKTEAQTQGFSLTIVKTQSWWKKTIEMSTQKIPFTQFMY